MHGPTAIFRPGQQAAVIATISGKQDVIIVLPTGGSKTDVTTLPAMIQDRDRVTLYIVPFIGLRDDLARRCRSIGIYCTDWSPESDTRTSIVFITPKSTIAY